MKVTILTIVMTVVLISTPLAAMFGVEAMVKGHAIKAVSLLIYISVTLLVLGLVLSTVGSDLE